MKFSDMKIGNRLTLGFSLILGLVLILSLFSSNQAKHLWDNTYKLYEHPLHVARATRDIKTNVYLIHRIMKDLVLAESEGEIDSLSAQIDSVEIVIHREFDVVYKRYLGPKQDIDDAYYLFTKWKPVRDRTIQLLRGGQTRKAVLRTKSTGAGGQLASEMVDRMQTVIDFANGRADTFYRTAAEEKRILDNRLLFLLIAILIATFVIGVIVTRGVRVPLEKMTNAAELFAGGHYDTRIQYSSRSELGKLAGALNHLAGTVEAELSIREAGMAVSIQMLEDNELESFSLALLIALRQHTDSPAGAVYYRAADTDRFECVACLGLSHDRGAGRAFGAGEGEIAAAVKTKTIQRTSEIPEDTVLMHATGFGDFRPREIVTIPLLARDEVVGVISLASPRPFSREALRVINDLWMMINSRFQGILLMKQIREYAATVRQQNADLEEKTTELGMQADELREYNIELEVQKRQLDEANRLKSTFLSSMSHELRTPLNSVIALTGVLNRRLAGSIPDEEYRYLSIIENSGKHLLELINDILDLARIESGREEIHLSEFSLHEQVSLVVSMQEPLAREKRLSLLNRIPTDFPQLYSDSGKCHHILQNLIGNAVKFTDKGKVEIQAVVKGTQVEIAVIDTGIGIHPEKFESIFEEFRQADERTSRHYGGTGLGLAIAEKYARMLNGRITVQSVPDQGSTFTLILPLTAAPERTSEDKSASSPSLVSPHDKRFDLSDKKILIVEDSEPAIIQISDILKEAGVQILLARDGEQALARVEEAPPDAIILDLMMPGIDGFEVLNRVRGKARTAHLPVVILTAKHLTKEELRFLTGNNIYQIISKGDINRRELTQIITNMLTESPRTEHLQIEERPVPERPHIMLIEDNPDNQATVLALLRDHVEVTVANDGLSGILLARERAPHLILLDISLPDLDGYEVFDTFRKDSVLREIPIVALTAHAMKGDRDRILNVGFDGYISKPINVEEFVPTIQRVLRGIR